MKTVGHQPGPSIESPLIDVETDSTGNSAGRSPFVLENNFRTLCLKCEKLLKYPKFYLH